MKFKLEKVYYMPKQLEPGVLYYTEEFRTCAHLCACGCGAKVRTPISPVEWTIIESDKGPSLYPSVGNWQLKCRSHYWINAGKVKWASQWTEEEILSGRLAEQSRRMEYYEIRGQENRSFILRFWNWLKTLF